MSRKAIVHKQQKLEEKRIKALKNGKKVKHPTKHYNRCRLTGRVGSYMREFGMSRIAFREYARQGKIMGVKKSSR